MTERITPDWLAAHSLQALFDALEQEGDSVRVVGGAVRNTLLGLSVSDIDLSTTVPPHEVARRVEKAGMKAVPTGIDHGTITVVAKGVAYEVTTLREDVETHGRHATVRFGRDWLRDAERRDFTMNALYADRDGNLFDPVGGLADLHRRRVRFIGDPAARIAEDFLRILRFFRFHAQYGAGEPDADGLHAVIAARDGLRHLSAERIGMEMRKLVAAPRAAETLALMSDTGLIEVVLAGVARIVDFRNLRQLDSVSPETRSPALGLAALAGFVDEDIARISDRMRLSNTERKRMTDALHMADRFTGVVNVPLAKEMVYRAGRVAALDGLLLHWARKGGNPTQAHFIELFEIVRSFQPPEFPIRGRDLLAAGIPKGPKVGETIAELEARWIASDFKMTRQGLLGLFASGVFSDHSESPER